ncbi:DUF402 domain-containing protein [soil metagenome]
MDHRWAPGDQVLLRWWRGPAVRQALAATVLADGVDELALWVATGTPMVTSVLADGRDARRAALTERFRLPRVHRLRSWTGGGIVVLVPQAAAHSVWLFFGEDGAFRLWYGNLEDRHVRWTEGTLRVVDTADHALDLLIYPDGRVEWKDEDEFAAATGVPDYWTAEEVPAIRAEGEALLARARAGAAPFDGRWTDFRPDPAWSVPELPAGWDLPRR